MKFEVSQPALLKPLQQVAGVVERRSKLPVLSHILLEVDSQNRMTITGTDLEVQICAQLDVERADIGETTVHAGKMLEICRELEPDQVIFCALSEENLSISSGRYKSRLSTLPATEFPDAESDKIELGFTISSAVLKTLLTKTAFAMAQHDVRYFFNGLLMEIVQQDLKVVATNGQRMAFYSAKLDGEAENEQRIVIPRKGVTELLKLISSAAEVETVDFEVRSNHMTCRVGEYLLTTKLIDGTFPDYNRAIPAGGELVFSVEKEALRDALSRTAILSNEMYRNVRLTLTQNNLEIQANNPLQEEAKEEIAVEYEGDVLSIAFNVGYLLEVLSVVGSDRVTFRLKDNKQAVIITEEDQNSLFIVSPMVL
jgi:DNA polymerase-3 subunit beta